MERQNTTITITTGTIVKTVFILAAVWLLYTLRDLALVVLTAIVIASAVEPAIAGLVKRRIPRILSVIIVYLLLLVSFFCVFYFFLPSVFSDLANFIGALPGYIDTIAHTGAVGHYTQIVSGSSDSFSSAAIIGWLQDALGFNIFFTNPFAAISAVFGGVFSLTLIIVFSFYFAVIETGVDDFLHIITPGRHQQYVLGLWRRSQRKIGLWMQGQILLAVIMGMLAFLGLTVFGVPHALALSVITALFEIIPVFGPVLSAVPAVAVAFAAGGLPLGLITIGLYIVAQQFENHLIYPLVVTRVVGVPPLLVILALIVGGQLAGFLGVILSVPAAATIRELVHDYDSGRLRQETQG